MERYVLRIQEKDVVDMTFNEIDLYFNKNDDEVLMGSVVKKALDSGYDVFLWIENGDK